jgi:hypothetical protein
MEPWLIPLGIRPGAWHPVCSPSIPAKQILYRWYWDTLRKASINTNFGRFLLDNALQYRDEGGWEEFREQIATASLAYVRVSIFHCRYNIRQASY